MRLTLKAFMSHDSSVVELPSRGVVLVGGPNGAGKSAIVEAVATAMWGRGLRGRWSPWRAGEAGRVSLEDAGFTVSRSWTGKSKSLRWKRGGPEVEFDTTSKAQESLEAVVGPFEVWRRTSVFSAADAAHFTMATDAERKELLESLLGLGWFDRALAACRADLRSAQTYFGQAQQRRDLASAKIEGAVAGLSRAQELLQEVSATGDVGLMRAEIARVGEHIKDIESELTELDERRAELLGVGGADRAAAAATQAKLARLKDDSCFACGQAVSDKLRSSMQREIKEAATAAERKAAAVQDELKKTVEARAELNDEASSLRGLLSKAREELVKVSASIDLRARAERQVKASHDESLQYQAQIDNATKQCEALAIEIAELEACERVLGVRGARAHVVGRTLAGIEGLANGWLARLSSEISIQLRPYTEKKSGGHVDAISLNLVGAGGESGYLGASAGERRRVDVALLLALAELAAGTHNGASWRSPIFFDECADSLDEDGRAAVIELIEDLARSRCVVVITHDTDTLTTLRSDLRLRIDSGTVSVI